MIVIKHFLFLKNLSLNRIKEIFANAKKIDNYDGKEISLNEKEFELAYNYILEKNIFLVLEKLGITPIVLIIVLLYIAVVMGLLFVFIF